MTEGEDIERIVYLSIETEDNILKRIRRTIEKSIDRENYSWNVARVLDDGIVKLTGK